MMIGSLLALLLPIIMLTSVHRANFIGLDSPCFFSTYSIGGVTFMRREKKSQLANEYRRLIGEPPPCRRSIQVDAQDLALFPFACMLSSHSGIPTSIAQRHLAGLASEENQRMTEAAKRQMLLDCFSLGAKDEMGMVSVQYSTMMMELLESQSGKMIDVDDLPDLNAKHQKVASP